MNNYIVILNHLEEECYLYDILKEDNKYYKQVYKLFGNDTK